ncbi:MAG: sulfatase-like hydrolase/transferase [Caldimonas sp.]
MVVWLALWLTVIGNLALWRELWTIGGGASIRIGAAGAFVMVFAATTALMALTAWGRAMKPVWIAILLAAGVAQHFMLAYGAVMDSTMLANTMQTDPREVRDLLGWPLFGNIALVALPAIAVLLIPVVRTPWWTQVWRNAVLFVAGVGVALAAAFAVYGELAPVVRSHMNLRYMVNPIGGLTSAVWVGLRPFFKKSSELVATTAGAGLGPTYAGTAKPPLLVVVVGETARADHFGLNGYPRDTTPELARSSDVLSFHHVRSCGTDTRASVPCMFSALGKEAFEKRKAEQENLLDVLQAAGLAVLWIDNQAGCKEVCARVPRASTADLSADAARGLCGDGECFDPALLVGLNERIAKLPPERRARGVVLVMHQMGSHGPAYFKRSPPALKRFLPECTNTALGDCDLATVINAYDNTIVTTDHFLAATIGWLRGQSTFAPALLYMSDHGESLGERGLFLHGLPYGMADEQTQVPFIAWIGPALAQRRGLDLACLRGRLDEPLSHDNLYSTVLGLVDVVTPTYQASLDAFWPCRKPV